MKFIKSVLFASFLIFSGCGLDSKSQPAQANPQNMPPVPVKAFKVEHKDVEISKTYPALIKPYEKVEIIARVNGFLEKKHFTEGQFVKVGDLLYTIEQDMYKAKLEQVKANLQKAQANLKKSEANLKKSEANLKKASSDYERAKSLYSSKSISDKEYDSYLNQFETTKSEIETTKAEIESAKAEIESSKANLKQAQIELDYTVIKSPINGIVGAKNLDVGNYVQTNKLLTTITSINPIYAEFAISKDDVSNYLEQIKSANLEIGNLKGKIDYISPTIDSSTNTLQIRAKFENEKNELIAGEFVKVSMNGIKIKNVATIPEQAILQTPNGAMVYVAVDGVATIRPVNIGVLTNSGIVINSGLNDGDLVVINNIAKVRPNSKITIVDGK